MSIIQLFRRDCNGSNNKTQTNTNKLQLKNKNRFIKSDNKLLESILTDMLLLIGHITE